MISCNVKERGKGCLLTYHDCMLRELPAHFGDELHEELTVPVGDVKADELHRERKMRMLEKEYWGNAKLQSEDTLLI